MIDQILKGSGQKTWALIFLMKGDNYVRNR